MTTLTLAALALLAGPHASEEELTSGRLMPPEQAAFDVTRYDLRIKVDPEQRRIDGTVDVMATLLERTETVVLDLDGRLEVRRVDFMESGEVDPTPVPVRFEQHGGELRISAPAKLAGVPIGEEFHFRIEYGGQPREAPRAPWDGGFVWAEAADGSPWIATANQMQGADLWWPCKDQPDDEPEEMWIIVTVPKPLVCASNGRLGSVVEEEEGWLTYYWQVTTPINAYGVALNIAPYKTITREYTSLAGDTFPITYWVLPENHEKGKVLMEDILRQTRFFEEIFGPYPFRGDKYGVAETPHLGMEHQTIIAYGNEYEGNPWGEDQGFDFLHYHEMAHEWWANLVTARNWNDFWIHEGFATYAQALYCERLNGKKGYLTEMANHRRGVTNRAAVAPRDPRSTTDMYFGNRPDSPGGDIYSKGSCILHALRWVVGDEPFFAALRRMAYPDPELEKETDGSACRFATTDEILAIAEEVTGHELDWFFELYLRQPALPELTSRRQGGTLRLSWTTPNDLPFPMPVEVRVDGELHRVEMSGKQGSLEVGDAKEVVVDPNRWLLKVEEANR